MLGLVVPGCLLDSDDRCGPNQELVEYAKESERCVCAAGFGFDATINGCKACGDNEMASNAGCLCIAGYARNSAADACAPSTVPLPTGQDTPCTTAADCAGFEASYCDNFVSFSCLVPGCTVSPDNCSDGKDCCDLSNFGLPMTLCIQAGACQS
ncbi:MAG: hypothetical protein RL033_5883 [Pseudomonadota bacterium]|jgi:hypothetical protein